MIDSSDKDRIDIAKQELFLILQVFRIIIKEEELKGVPVAILANKQDVEGCLTDVQVFLSFKRNRFLKL